MWCANQLTGFYMRATLAFNELRTKLKTEDLQSLIKFYLNSIKIILNGLKNYGKTNKSKPDLLN